MSSKINFKKYLKDLMILESEKLRLDKIHLLWKLFSDRMVKVEKNKKIMYCKKIEYQRKNEIKNIKIKRIEKPVPPERPKKVKSVDKKNVIFFIMGLTEVSGGILLQTVWISIVGACCAIYFGFGVFEQIGAKREYKDKIKEYERNLYDYSQKMKRYSKKQKANENKIKKITDEINKKYDEQIKIKEKIYEDQYNEIIKIRNENNKEIMKIIESNIKRIKNNLERLYDLDIIFGKYRNFIDISTFYEYFMTSKVFELEGKEGAYFLYEQESKQKEIITNMEAIPSDLNKIKKKQYCVYEALSKNKNSILEIEKNINKIIKEIKNTNYNIDIIKNYILNCKNEINKNEKQIKNIEETENYK